MHYVAAHIQLITSGLLFLVWAPVIYTYVRQHPDHLGAWGLYLASSAPSLALLANPEAERGQAGPTPWHDLVSQTTVFASFALVVLSVTAVRGRRVSTPIRWLLAYCVVVILAGTLNGDFDFRWLAMPSLVLVVARANLGVDRLVRHLRYATRITTFGSLGLLLTVPDIATWSDNGRTLFGIAQLAGTTPHPNALGPVSALALGVELATVDRRRSKLAILAALACVVLAQSRSGWVCAAMVFLALALHRGMSRWVLYFATVALVADTLRTFNLLSAEGILNGRDEVWRSTLEIVGRGNLLIGSGPNAFSTDARARLTSQVAAIVGQAHNQALTSLAIGGLIGLTVTVCFLGSVIAAHRRTRHGWLAGAVVAMLLFFQLVESPIGVSRSQGAFIVIAVVLLVTAHGARAALPAHEPAPLAEPAYRGQIVVAGASPM